MRSPFEPPWTAVKIASAINTVQTIAAANAGSISLRLARIRLQPGTSSSAAAGLCIT
ncbi:MAG: hypothetical protein ABSC42_17870 [Tepidisphaeraceae bacterium]